MKKIITTILIMIFATNIPALANGILTIDKDGNIKYQEEISTNSNLTEPQNSATTLEQINNNEKSVVQETEKRKLSGPNRLPEQTINNISLTSQTTTQQHKVKINVKDINKNDETLIKYDKNFYKYSNRDYSYFYKSHIDDYLKGYKHYNYPENDNFNKNDKKIIRFELQDGDYVILDNSVKGNRKYKYAAEYNKDGSLFGVVQIKTIRKTRKSITIAFYEYRQNEENLSEFNAKHTMFLDIKKEKGKVDIAQFVYKGSVFLENLVCAQINNDLYLDKESKNLIVKMQKFDIPQEPLFNQVVKENIYNTFGFLGMSLAICFVLALGPYGWLWLWVAISVSNA